MKASISPKKEVFGSKGLYCGIQGAKLEIESFDLGEGLTLSQTFVHIFSPDIAAFSPPPKDGAPHPAPWKTVSTSDSPADIWIELTIPPQFNVEGLNDSAAISLILSMLRLKVSPLITLPVVSDHPFSVSAHDKIGARLIRVEKPARGILKVGDDDPVIQKEDLEWVASYWKIVAKLNKNKRFSRAFASFDGSGFSRGANDAIIILWGALEQLFSGKNQELAFRASGAIASFLEPVGDMRYGLYLSTKKLYDGRSKVAHGGALDEESICNDVHALVQRCLMKIIESGVLPEVEDIERNIFDNHMWPH